MNISDRPVGAPPRELPLFLQIARSLGDDIRSGRLAPGTRLPGTRTLASELGVHRNTVLAAYAELGAEGWIETTRALGTFVSESLPEPRRTPAQGGRSLARQPGFALRAAPADADAVPPPPGTLVMSGGSPDLRLIPSSEISRAYRRALQRHGRSLLAYGDPRGDPRLRAALAEMLASSRGLPLGADDLVITRGSQMALALVARALIAPGDVIAVEALGYPPAWQAMTGAGAELAPVSVDADGVDVEALARLARRRRLRAVYVTPHHQYPTTATLIAPRRLALLELARRHRFAIIEDDYDHEFHYEWRPVLPLASADRAGVVIYIGTLSKILAPGLRLGYVAAPRSLLDHVALGRRYLDRQGDHVLEHAIAELVEDGELGRHARRMRRVYLRRRDALVSALRRRLGGALDFSVPPGGMALWTRVSSEIDVDGWAERARALALIVHPARQFSFDRRTRPYLRLGFAALDESELARAVDRLARAL
jgi:GntR family transcriptional regulator / MocR family aminotransferase